MYHAISKGTISYLQAVLTYEPVSVHSTDHFLNAPFQSLVIGHLLKF